MIDVSEDNTQLSVGTAVDVEMKHEEQPIPATPIIPKLTESTKLEQMESSQFFKFIDFDKDRHGSTEYKQQCKRLFETEEERLGCPDPIDRAIVELLPSLMDSETLICFIRRERASTKKASILTEPLWKKELKKGMKAAVEKYLADPETDDEKLSEEKRDQILKNWASKDSLRQD